MGFMSLSWEAVAAACCRQWGLELLFFVACCLLSWDQSAHLTCCAQLALAVTTDLLPEPVDELVMIHATLATWFPVLTEEEKAAKSYIIKKRRSVSVNRTIKSLLGDVMGTLPGSMISLMTALENTIRRVTLGAWNKWIKLFINFCVPTPLYFILWWKLLC